MLGIIGILIAIALASGIFGFGGLLAVSAAGIIKIVFYISLIALVVSIVMHFLRPKP